MTETFRYNALVRRVSFALLVLVSGCERMTGPQGLTITGVSETGWCSDSAPAELDIEGLDFFVRTRLDLERGGPVTANAEFRATLGNEPFTSLTWVSNTVLRGRPPQHLQASAYELTVIGPDGSIAP